ncbi:hypothetical protein ONA24_06375 [Mycoplasmopsis cynos]|uniref:transketolase-like TK C-terminal-containing protein n=1 Tax=Mycoplasmopsis cynos TaxID=171284 RepID=UPI0024C949DE|nr:hypothetical protein [Mycoplasmopsis cynos]WAM10429.1 hypothetical protein ONA24_06375 [Mycoplasmopsis cynos]
MHWTVKKHQVQLSRRQEVKSFNIQPNEFKAAYFIKEYQDAKITLLASGSEVHLAYNVSRILQEQNINANVISVLVYNYY